MTNTLTYRIPTPQELDLTPTDNTQLPKQHRQRHRHLARTRRPRHPVNRVDLAARPEPSSGHGDVAR